MTIVQRVKNLAVSSVIKTCISNRGFEGQHLLIFLKFDTFLQSQRGVALRQRIVITKRKVSGTWISIALVSKTFAASGNGYFP